MNQVGRTIDGKIVLDGLFGAYETHGIPLDTLIAAIHEDGMVPCWLSFYDDAIKAGMKHSRIVAKLDEAISDAVSAAYRDVVIAKLLEHRNGKHDSVP
jgi:hypothetical protein